MSDKSGRVISLKVGAITIVRRGPKIVRRYDPPLVVLEGDAISLDLTTGEVTLLRKDDADEDTHAEWRRLNSGTD